MTFADLLSSEIMGLTVIAALVGVVGSWFGVILKDFFFTRAFERWKTKQTLQRVYVRFTDPIFLSASDLCNRLKEICERHPAPYLSSKYLRVDSERMETNTANDPYFQRYKLLSSVYRFCSFLGWLELFRQEIVFLDSGRSLKNRRLENKLNAIRSDLADGQLNTAKDWILWHDRLIFREEQRAIGEKMIVRINNTVSVMGYAEFCEKLVKPSVDNQDQWIRIALSFIADPSDEDKDFHLIRLNRLIIHLVELMMVLDRKRVRRDQREWRKNAL